MKARLIAPAQNPAIVDGEPSFDGCEYSKCGRTDKGVSAFGQVIGIRVRSNRPLTRSSVRHSVQLNGIHQDAKNIKTPLIEQASLAPGENEITDDLLSLTSTSSLDEETIAFHPVSDEIPYCQVINRLLPPDIRILAWCPSPPQDFSARFSCRERQYTYFFTQPAYTPTTGASASSQFLKEDEHRNRRHGYLDISAMQAAAKKFEGTHDFRNFCKVDPSKQIDNFARHIFHASITEQNTSDNVSISNLPASYVSDPTFQEFTNHNASKSLSPSREGQPSQTDTTTATSAPDPRLFAFHLHGNAFLWHQVRHMVAILFLIGQGLEPPSLIDELFDISKNPCRPHYEMANGIPLVLWNCVFPDECSNVVNPVSGRAKDAMEWVYVGGGKGYESGISLREKSSAGAPDGRYGTGGLVDELWRVWRGRKMDEVLAGRLLDVAARQGIQDTTTVGEENVSGKANSSDADQMFRTQFGSLNAIKSSSSQRMFQGADGAKNEGTYVPVLEKPRMESVEMINKRYREKKGLPVRDKIKAEGRRKMPL